MVNEKINTGKKKEVVSKKTIKKEIKSCDDKHCPIHNNLKLRGRSFQGVILSKDTHKTAVVGWERSSLIRKYERYELKKSKVKVHNPLCITAKVGDKVKIVECRPLSKTKSFVIVEVIE